MKMGGCMELTSRDTLDTTTASETADSRLGDTLDVVAKNLAVTLSTALAEALATFTACIRACQRYRSVCKRSRRDRDGQTPWVRVETYVQSF